MRRLLGAEQRGVERERRRPCAPIARKRSSLRPPREARVRRRLRAQRRAQRCPCAPRRARTAPPRRARTAGSSARSPAPDRPPAAAARRRAPSGPSPRYARSAPAGRRRRPAHAGVLQRADDRLEQRAALAHQDQDVARRACPGFVQRRRVAAILRRQPRPARLVSVSSSNGASQASISRLSVGLERVPDLDQARRRFAAALRAPASTCRPIARGTPPAARTPCRPRPARSGPSGTSGGTAHLASPGRSPAQSFAKARRIASNSRGAAPWNEKIDCFSSPTAKIVRLTVARARAGEELVGQRRMISHCFGLVSCASSISTWSMPRSSL